jgi:hypothetical protein
MFGWFRKRRSEIPQDAQAMVRVYLNPLHAMLHAAEQRKGAPLTQAEVLQVRDMAVAVEMTEEQARRFYASLDAQVQVHRMNPDRIWEEWQDMRHQIT